jgi:hypothetical protein
MVSHARQFKRPKEIKTKGQNAAQGCPMLQARVKISPSVLPSGVFARNTFQPVFARAVWQKPIAAAQCFRLLSFRLVFLLCKAKAESALSPRCGEENFIEVMSCPLVV